jgi:hypothetical protein
LAKEDDSTRQKATFQIIPQLTMKRRCVTFGKEQIVDLLYFLAKEDQVGDFIKEEQVLSKVVVTVDKKNKKQETTTLPKARKRKGQTSRIANTLRNRNWILPRRGSPVYRDTR